jgi:hypothetical protein
MLSRRFQQAGTFLMWLACCGGALSKKSFDIAGREFSTTIETFCFDIAFHTPLSRSRRPDAFHERFYTALLHRLFRR